MITWERKELKDKAKATLKRGYWKIVLVSFIFALISGGSSGGSSSSGNYNQIKQDFKDSIKQEYSEVNEDYYYDDEIVFEEDFDDVDDAVKEITNRMGEDDFDMATVAVIMSIVFVAVFIAILVAVVLEVFLLNPLNVGCSRFFVNQSISDAELKEMGFAFKSNYKNVIKIMFFKGLFEFLWSLLFIIPGIIKSYEYRMIPYILAENPDMSMEEVFAKSKQLMTEQKWNAFVLDLSFMGWIILGALTIGILNLFYVNPYMYLTNSELYLKLTENERNIPEETITEIIEKPESVENIY